MIPVEMKNEPGDFAEKVTKRAEDLLKKIPNPGKKDIDNRPYWSYALDDLRSGYKNICAYSGLYILGGEQTVDHYLPRSKTWKTEPMMAYKWNNFRLASWGMNNEKGESSEVVDPFKIGYNWFIIDFENMFIKSGPRLNPADKADVNATILRLKLNKGKYHDYRLELMLFYYDSVMSGGNIDQALHYLEWIAPFIAYELKRQKLTRKVLEIIKSSGNFQKNTGNRGLKNE